MPEYPMMKLAVKKEPASIPGAGFNYFLFPLMPDQNSFLELMGYVIIEVPVVVGDRLLREAGEALRHQCEIAVYADAFERLKK